MDAKEQARKILWALYKAVRIGEPMSVEKTIIENGLNEFHQAKSKEEAQESDTLLLDTINKALRKWGVKEKLSFGNGIELLTCLQEEMLAAFRKEGEG